MELLVLLLFLSIFSTSAVAQSEINDPAYISAIISEKGLDFVKNLLIEQELRALTPLRLPDIKKSIKIPIVGIVEASISNITLAGVNVSSSTIHPGDTGVVIVVSGATVNLSLNWMYSYSNTWLIPIKISDSGSAFIEVDGMEVGLTMTMKNRNGTLGLTLSECGCYMEDILIKLDGGASWFYQGFVDAFEDQIRSAVDKTITKQITEGTSKLDSLLQGLPKKIDVGKDAALNVTFTNDPMLRNSSIEFDINGLFVSSEEVPISNYLHKTSQFSDSCLGTSNMLGISLDESVFNSASMVYFQEGLLHCLVDKAADQSLLNTARWKYIVPRMYRMYPNDDMQLNLTLTSPPIIWIKPQGIGGTITSDMTVIVVDANETIPVVCITVVVAVSGVVEVSGNNLVGKAILNDFTLKLKWSKVGNIHMYLIQEVIQVFIKTVFLPIINSHLRQGFPLPIVHGITLQNASIIYYSSKIVVCSDAAAALTNSSVATHSAL